MTVKNSRSRKSRSKSVLPRNRSQARLVSLARPCIARSGRSPSAPSRASISRPRACRPSARDVVAGPAALSTTRTSIPRVRRSQARASPVGPAPTIRTTEFFIPIQVRACAPDRVDEILSERLARSNARPVGNQRVSASSIVTISAAC
jgi:hypothetical protein